MNVENKELNEVKIISVHVSDDRKTWRLFYKQESCSVDSSFAEVEQK